MSSLRQQIEKKKAQEEMRRLMAERKKKDLKPVKIENPLARLNSLGQLTCILCSSVVRSEHVWQVHVNSKQHRENVEQAKKLKELTNNFTEGKIKNINPIPHEEAPPKKKIKGILKNPTVSSLPVNAPASKNNALQIVSFHDVEIKRTPILPITNMEFEEGDNIELDGTNQDAKQIISDQSIPEGFFDDPVLDAKIRNIEYKDPKEEEWERFQKEIKEEATASAEIIAGEQEEATAERQIDEIDEQIRNWSRVLDLELKKEETKKKTMEIEQMSENEEFNSDNEEDIDEFLDWRSKKSFS